MGSRYEVEVTMGSARELKNVNWRHGELKPYTVVWVDQDEEGPKCSTRVDLDNGESPVWDDEKLLVPLPPSYSSAVLYIDVVHANAAEGVKPLVGSARLPLRDVLDDGAKVSRTLRLKRPSGRPQGRLDVRVAIRESARYPPYDQPAPYPYGQPAGAGGSRDPYYGQQQPGPYAAGYPAATAAGYAYGGQPAAAYGGAPPVSTAGYAAPSEVQQQQQQGKQSGKTGMGTGLAVGAAAGVLGGLALAGGASYLENKFEDNVAERVEDDAYGAGDGGYDDDY